MKFDLEAKQLASPRRREQYPIWIAHGFLYLWFFAGCVWCFRIGSDQGYALLAIIHVVFYLGRYVVFVTKAVAISVAEAMATQTEIWARRNNQGMIDFWESMQVSGKDAKFDWPSAGETVASDMRSENSSKAIFNFNSRAGNVGTFIFFAFWELSITALRLFVAATLANLL